MRLLVLILLLGCASEKPCDCPRCATLPTVKLMTLKDTTEMILYTGHDFVYQPEVQGGNLLGKKVRVKIILLDGQTNTIHKEE